MVSGQVTDGLEKSNHCFLSTIRDFQHFLKASDEVRVSGQRKSLVVGHWFDLQNNA